jgi:membrane associated rhomboid family serine protease
VIPIRDINPTRITPVVVYVFLGTNVFVWLYQWSVAMGMGPEALQALVMRFGAVPYLLVEAPEVFWYQPFTSMFMHGGWFHLIMNMWFLWIFGDNVEEALGKLRFVLFYVLCGLGAVAAQVLVAPDSRIPMVGASGAISGVLAGYVVLFPHARVLTLVPLLFLFYFAELPAFLFILLWFGLQLLQGTLALGTEGAGMGGVAWWAHIGGFVVGLLLVRPMRKYRGVGHPSARPRFER